MTTRLATLPYEAEHLPRGSGTSYIDSPILTEEMVA